MGPKDILPSQRILRELPHVALAKWETDPLIRKAIAANSGANLVAVDEKGRIIGALLGGCFRERGTISHVGVVDAYQRAGVGRALCVTAIKNMFDGGATVVHVLVEAENEKASNFWKNKMGFVLSEDRIFMEVDVAKATFPRENLLPAFSMSAEFIFDQFGLEPRESENASFVENHRASDFGGIIIAGDFGVRGTLRNLRFDPRLLDTEKERIGGALISRSLSELFQAGVLRTHAFPHRNNQEKIRLLTIAGFNFPTDLFLELRDPTRLPQD